MIKDYDLSVTTNTICKRGEEVRGYEKNHKKVRMHFY